MGVTVDIQPQYSSCLATTLAGILRGNAKVFGIRLNGKS